MITKPFSSGHKTEIHNVYLETKSELLAIEALMLSTIRDASDILSEAITHDLMDSIPRGKGVRSILTVLLGRMLGCQHAHIIKLATAIEMIHVATLLHDDVIDLNTMRRQTATAHTIFSNRSSILIGDFLLGTAFHLVASLNSLPIVKAIIRCTTAMINGELAQLSSLSQCKLSFETYFSIISNKTAQLFIAICHSIAISSECSDTEMFAEFGQNIGLAFQIVDDVLDYVGTTDKKHGNDFRNGQMTLPVIVCYAHADQEEKKFWSTCMSDEEQRGPEHLNTAMHYIQKHQAIEYGLDCANGYIRKAMLCIENFRDTKEYPLLKTLLDFVVYRNT